MITVPSRVLMQLNDLHDIRITITSSFSDKLQLQLVRVRLWDKLWAQMLQCLPQACHILVEIASVKK